MWFSCNLQFCCRCFTVPCTQTCISEPRNGENQHVHIKKERKNTQYSNNVVIDYLTSHICRLPCMSWRSKYMCDTDSLSHPQVSADLELCQLSVQLSNVLPAVLSNLFCLSSPLLFRQDPLCSRSDPKLLPGDTCKPEAAPKVQNLKVVCVVPLCTENTVVPLCSRQGCRSNIPAQHDETGCPHVQVTGGKRIANSQRARQPPVLQRVCRGAFCSGCICVLTQHAPDSAPCQRPTVGRVPPPSPCTQPPALP